MGTNYYLTEKPNVIGALSGELTKERHIGKSSGGWCFSLHVYPDEGIHTVRDWYKLLRRNKNQIYDEYERDVTIDELMAVITDRSWGKREPGYVPSGYRSLDHFYQSNHAMPGPNNLLRHIIEPGHCIGHGGGTFDYIIGDFS